VDVNATDSPQFDRVLKDSDVPLAEAGTEARPAARAGVIPGSME
jgi:hypothetical protein